MQLPDFRQLVRGLLSQVPVEYQQSVVTVDVSPKAVPHPVRADVYTLGECIPLEWSGDGSDLQSRVVLYHGSFQALAHQGEFDWRDEAWETLTHELRHHLEWRARVGALEAYDEAAEQNFARHEGQGFDPAFYRLGEKIEDGVYKVEDDVFVEMGDGRGEWDHHGVRSRERHLPVITWHGRGYRVPLPPDLGRPAFVTLEGLDEPPPGEAVLVLPRRASLLDIFRRRVPIQVTVTVEPEDG